MQEFLAYVVEEHSDGSFHGQVQQRNTDMLPQGDILIRVAWSSLNYKDALSATGNRAVTRNYPHIPGIDAAGIVESSNSSDYSVGDEVIITGYDFGANSDGGLSEYIRVPASWAVPLPKNLSLKEAMIFGTAGLTAAIGLYKISQLTNNVFDGDALVTGATGGVGSLGVMLFAKAGFKVTASTGKKEHQEWLQQLGATEVLPRQELSTENSKPLLSERWQCVLDCVGGHTLCNAIKALHYGGSAACCGLVESPQLMTTVFPFILRGINLLGIDSVQIDHKLRCHLWQQLGSDWKPEKLEVVGKEITLSQVTDHIQLLLKGDMVGRVIVNMNS